MSRLRVNKGAVINVKNSRSEKPLSVVNASGTEVISVTRTGDVDVTTLDVTTLKLGGTALTSSISELNGLTGVTASAAELNQTKYADRLPKTVKVALTAASTTAAGGVLTWRNEEESSAILVTRFLVDITHLTSGAGVTLDFGYASSVASADTLLDGAAVGSGDAVKVFDNQNDTDNGTNGIAKAYKLADDYYITGTASADATGLTGYAYITYIAL
jgi:hypothetical protein